MKKIAKKSVKVGSASNFRKGSLGSSSKRPMTAKPKKPFKEIINANTTSQERGFMGQNEEYQLQYANLGSSGMSS